MHITYRLHAHYKAGRLLLFRADSVLHKVEPTHAPRRALSAWWYASPRGEERMPEGRMVCVRSRYALRDPRRSHVYERSADGRRDARRLLEQMGGVAPAT